MVSFTKACDFVSMPIVRLSQHCTIRDHFVTQIRKLRSQYQKMVEYRNGSLIFLIDRKFAPVIWLHKQNMCTKFRVKITIDKGFGGREKAYMSINGPYANALWCKVILDSFVTEKVYVQSFEVSRGFSIPHLEQKHKVAIWAVSDNNNTERAYEIRGIQQDVNIVKQMLCDYLWELGTPPMRRRQVDFSTFYEDDE